MSDEKPIGTIDVDATQPLIQVVDELLRLANKRVFAVVRRRSRGFEFLCVDAGSSPS